jgi:hypothetical protein
MADENALLKIAAIGTCATAVATMFGATLSFLNNILARRTETHAADTKKAVLETRAAVVETQGVVKEVEKQSNSMREALVAATAKSSLQEGQIQGKAEAIAEHDAAKSLAASEQLKHDAAFAEGKLAGSADLPSAVKRQEQESK